MHDRPTLALLIPAFNAAEFLPRLLGSAAAQTEPFDEIWVYDDCSTDDTARTAERLGARVLRGEVNRGCSHGKNALAKHTTCTWVHFHDADDDLTPNFVETARKWMRSDEYDAVAFGCVERDADTGEVISVASPDHDRLKADPVGATIEYKINSSSGIYRRDNFIDAGGYDLDPRVLYNEDQAMHSAIARAGLRFGGDPTVTVLYFRRSGSMSNANRAKCVAARYHVLRKTLDVSTTQEHRVAIARQLWIVAGVAGAFLDWPTADSAATLALELASPSVAAAGPTFKTLCRISPRFALRIREVAIRLLRPHTRTGYPRLEWFRSGLKAV